MNPVLKWTGIVAGGLVMLVVAIAASLYVVGGSKLSRTYDIQPTSLAIPINDSEAIARGAHLAVINGCTDCHGADFSGKVMVDDPPFRVVASNLTSGAGGIGSRYSDADFDRSIRHGVRPDGRPLFIMPSAAYNRLSDADAADIIAYLRSVPAVDSELPGTEIRTVGRLLAAFAIDPAFEVRTGAARATAPSVGPTAEYGEYMASITCAYCHGDDMNGAQPPNPDSPYAPSLAAAAVWPLEQFKSALRTGVTPAGYELDVEFMPWSFTKQMTEDELDALYLFLNRQFAGSTTAGL
jgi:mono/diheme cytochrome c family protein